MRGVSHSAVQENEFGIDENSSLLDDLFTGHQCPYVSDGSNQVEPQHGRSLQDGTTAKPEIPSACCFSEADGDGRDLDAYTRRSPLPIDERVSKEYVKEIDADHGIPGSRGVACSLENRRQNLYEDGTGNDEDHECRIGKSQLNHSRFCTQLLRHLLL
jgi:hypothetical protein